MISSPTFHHYYYCLKFINFQISVYFSENNIFFFSSQCVTKNSIHKVIENIYLLISRPRLTGQRVKNNQKYCDTTFGRRDVIYITPILNLFTARGFPQFKGQGKGKYYVLVADHMLVLREPHDLHFQHHLIQVNILDHFTQLSDQLNVRHRSTYKCYQFVNEHHLVVG